MTAAPMPVNARRETIVQAIERTKERLMRLSRKRGLPGVAEAMAMEQRVLRHLLVKARVVK